MATKIRGSQRGQKLGHVIDVQFAEVEFVTPSGTRMIIELGEEVRLLVGADADVDLAARLISALIREQKEDSR